jgi:hypothetical protein
MRLSRKSDKPRFEQQVLDIYNLVKSGSPTKWQSGELFQDWIGNHWHISTFPSIPLSVADISVPLNGDGFRAGGTEWFGFALGLKLALGKKNSVMIELGASQAPWCLSWLRAFEKLNPESTTTALGVEAGLLPNQLVKFWTDQNLNGHVLENPTKLEGVDATLIYENSSQKQKFIMLNKAVTYKNLENVYFPVIDITKDNGARISKKALVRDYRGFSIENRSVPAVTFSKIIGLYNKIDFLHMDLQGEELKIVRYLFWNQLSKKCSVMLIGTHSNRSHYLWQILLKLRGYLLYESESPVIRNRILVQDGEILAIAKRDVKTILA